MIDNFKLIGSEIYAFLCFLEISYTHLNLTNFMPQNKTFLSLINAFQSNISIVSCSFSKIHFNETINSIFQFLGDNAQIYLKDLNFSNNQIDNILYLFNDSRSLAITINSLKFIQNDAKFNYIQFLDCIDCIIKFEEYLSFVHDYSS